ncbi:hypothetical protein M9H77_03659 [Catharanthus roseus]|uniref:Uncharacterized protein n=1 Tax=Catharanthus roseus TaxID=4058 RepID=A0ACC0CBW4_CATRO|nr:hypothetical protein M9H77_03659 [Catharanthus roseus]
MKDLTREEEAMLEQSSRRNLGGNPMHNNQEGYGNFSPHARSYEHNSYDCYEENRLGTRNGYNDTSCKRVPRNKVKNGGNYMIMDEWLHKKRGNVERYYDIYEHYEYSYSNKREEIREDCCDISSPLNSLSSEENSTSIPGLLNYNLWTKSNHGMKAKEEGMEMSLALPMKTHQ